MSDLPILYSFRRCPYAMRARMALIVSGMRCELREVKLSAKPPEMIAASPKGTVPVLVLPDGQVVDQSFDIMLWALERHDPEGWLEGDDRALIATFDGPFKQQLDRYKYPDRHDSDPDEARLAGLTLLTTLEERLRLTENLCRDARSLADIAIMPFVRQFAETDRAWFDTQAIPAVRAWLVGHLESALFLRAMQREAPWSAVQPAVLFP